MPDLFESPDTTARDQRFRDDASIPTPPTQPTVTPTTVEPMMPQGTAIPVVSDTRMQRLRSKIHRMNLFTSFCENPPDIKFNTQEPDETILIFMRKSNFINLPWIFFSIVMAFLPLILYLFRNQYAQITPPIQFIEILIPLYYILILSYAFVHFMIWYYNAAIVTNKRVIDIDFHQLILKEVNETHLSLVQDVSFRQDGVFENMFNFGYVLIQTAGTIDNFEFYGLPNPDRVVEVIQPLIGGKLLNGS